MKKKKENLVLFTNSIGAGSLTDPGPHVLLGWKSLSFSVPPASASSHLALQVYRGYLACVLGAGI